MGAYSLDRIFLNPFIYFSFHALQSGLNLTLECSNDTCSDCTSSPFRKDEEVEGVEGVRKEEEVEKVEVSGGEGGRDGHHLH
jgi:hypothetical protein